MQAPPGLDCCYRHVRITLSQLAAMVSGDDEGGGCGGRRVFRLLFILLVHLSHDSADHWCVVA